MRTCSDTEGLPLALRLLRTTPLGNRLGLMERLFGRRLANRGVCWVDTATGIPWKVDLGDPCHRWMVYGDYADPGFLGWAREHVPCDGVIVDSGSNIGQFLPYFAEMVPEGKVLAYEPSPRCSRWIEACLARQAAGFPVDLMTCGLSDSNGELFLNDWNNARHGLWGELKEQSGPDRQKVRVRRLDDEMREQGIDRVDLWKLDVEGHEVCAIEGGRALLEKEAVSALYVELKVEGGNNRRITEKLDSLDYGPFRADRSGTLHPLETLPQREIDALFLPR